MTNFFADDVELANALNWSMCDGNEDGCVVHSSPWVDDDGVICCVFANDKDAAIAGFELACGSIYGKLNKMAVEAAVVGSDYRDAYRLAANVAKECSG